MSAVEGGSDIVEFGNHWRFVAVFDDPVELIADRVAAVYDDKGVRALSAYEGVEAFEGDLYVFIRSAGKGIVVATAIVHDISMENVISQAAVQVTGEAIGHTNGGIVWRGIEDKAQWRLEVGVVLDQRICVGIISQPAWEDPSEPEPEHGVIASSTLEGHMLGGRAILQCRDRALQSRDLEVVGAILEVGDLQGWLERIKGTSMGALEILGFSVHISVPDISSDIGALVFYDISHHILIGSFDLPWSGSNRPGKVVLEFAGIGEVVLLVAHNERRRAIGCGAIFLGKNLARTRGIHELKEIRICEGETDKARCNAYSAVIAAFRARDRGKTGYFALTRIRRLLGDDQHELADAIGRLVDIDGGDEFIGSTTGDNVVIHIILYEGVVAYSTNHGVEAASAIKIVVTGFSIEVIAASRADHSFEEGLRASIIRSRCVEVWAGVEIGRVAVEGVIASRTKKGILAAHTKQYRGGKAGGDGITKSIADPIDCSAQKLEMLEVVEGFEILGGKRFCLVERRGVVRYRGVELVDPIALDRIKIEISANKVDAPV